MYRKLYVEADDLFTAEHFPLCPAYLSPKMHEREAAQACEVMLHPAGATAGSHKASGARTRQ